MTKDEKSKMTESYVLDSYAIVAYQFGEKGKDKIEEILLAASSGNVKLYLNLINFGEVYYIIHRNKNETIASKAIAMVKRWPLEIIIPDEKLTLVAARVKAKYPLSYADAFAISTAIKMNAMVITGDLEIKKVENIVRILWIGK